MLLKDVIQKTTAFFKERGIASARLDTELLMATALGWERIKLYLNYEYPLSEDEVSKSRELVRRRASGEPIAYILGHKDFYKSKFIVTPDVLIPRPETELIVEMAVDHLRAQLEISANDAEVSSEDENGLKWIVDLGTGSGCIGLSILLEIPDLHLLAVDVSAAALKVAGQNAERLGLGERVKFLAADASNLRLDSLRRTFKDAVVVAVLANPPYISENDPNVEEGVRKFEPSLALFSEAEGLAAIATWSRTAADLADPGALVVFEIGATQAQKATELFANVGRFEKIESVRDLSGRDRFIKAFVTAKKA